GRQGAQGERIERCALGWTVPDIRDPAQTLFLLSQLVREPERLDRAVASMRRAEALIPVETMWHVYAEIYESVAVPRQAPTAAPEACRQYVTHLSAEWHDSSAASLTGYETELLGLRQLLRSPRYRFADALATGLMRIPGLWQVITKAQDALDRRTNRRS